jgi:hypothetical protein
MTKGTVEPLIEATQERLLELQSEIELTLSRARALLFQAGEEIRQLRTQVEKDNLKVYTEEEAAAVLKIGKTTLRHLRTATPGFPCWRVGSTVRYANFHLMRIIESLESKRR